MKSFYFNIRAVALINVVCSDQKAQINECASPQPTTHPAQQVFPFLSADDKTASSQMPPRHDRAAPLLHLIGNKIPLFSMSGLKHVYTSVAQWQVMAGDTQGLHTANKQERNMVSVCGGAAQTNTGNYKVPWKMMTFFFFLTVSLNCLVTVSSEGICQLNSLICISGLPAARAHMHGWLSRRRLLTHLLGDLADFPNAIVITRANFAQVDSCNE